MNEFIALSYSAWSEKARWALDHHGISYREKEYAPMLGEPGLRLKLRRFTGKVTVPVLLTDREVITDSLDIARHAERTGHGTRLFPENHLGEILDWNQKSEMTLEAGRALSVSRVLQDQEAQAESLPPFIPGALRGALTPVARSGALFLSRKYHLTDESLKTHQARMREQLVALRKGLEKSSPYLTGRFSFADIVMAVALQFVVPVDDRFIHLGPHTRKAMTEIPLAEEFADLIQWRDLIYGKHRKARK